MKTLLIMGDSGRIYGAKRKDIYIGIQSKQGKKHIILLDYDGISKEKMLNNLSKLQEKYGLSHFYVMRSSRRHFHAVCFSPVSWKKYVSIMFDSLCCVNFRYFTILRKGATLRVSKKEGEPIKLHEIVVKRLIPKEGLRIKEYYFKVLGWEG